MKKCKRILACLLCAVMLTTVFPAGFLEASAASFEDINNSSVFVKQNTNYTCTLASAVMLVRRTAMAAGNSNWASITESSMRGTAWLEGSGLYYNFTYAGVSVGHANAGSDRKIFYINLLKQYPQGVVAYNQGNGNQWHAILLTDYNSSTDTFYCADPANGTASGRITLASSSIVGSGQNGKINNLNEYWYVKSPSISLTSSDNVAPTIHGTYIGSEIPDPLNYFRACCIVSDNIGISKVMLATWSDPNQADLVWRECYHNGSGIYFMDIKYSSHASGAKIYYNHFYVYDTAGNCSFADITFNRYPIVTFNPTGGTAYKTTKNSSFTLTYGWSDYNTVDWLAPQKNGYTFKGWYDKETGGNLIYDVNGKAVNDNNHWRSDWCAAINDYMVYAQWICNHAVYSNTVTKAATCNTTGIKTYTCSCGYSYTEEIDALGHDIVDHDKKDPACTEKGWSAYQSCSRCDYSTYSEIPANGHTEVVDPAKAATCTETGLTEGKHCSVCDEILTAQEEIPATGHSDSDNDNICDSCGENLVDSSDNGSSNSTFDKFMAFINMILDWVRALFIKK